MCANQLAGPLRLLSDSKRLEALRTTHLFGSPPEEAFDRLTRLACDLMDTPIALVSLVSEERQFFKSACGLGADVPRETPLSHSFCKHVVAGEQPLVVEDARAHPLVRDNPAVDDHRVAAYLGVPLRAPGGEVLGSFCVIDHEPRRWSGQDVGRIETLAKGAATEIALRIEVRERQGWQERYCLLFEGSPEPVVVHRDAVVVAANDAAAEVAGVGVPERLEGRSLLDFITGEQHTLVEHRLQRIRQGEAVPPLELRIHSEAGETRIVESVSSPVQWKGEVLTQSVLRDVTRRVVQEETLRASEERARRLALLADRTINGVIFTDAAGRIEWVNEGFLRLTGYTRDEVLGRRPGALLQGPATAQEAVAHMSEKRAAREVFTQELINYHKSGAPYWVRVEVQPLVNEAGTLTGFMGLQTDITERKRAEQRLRRQKEVFEKIVENLPVMVTFFDEEGHFELVNRAWTETLGWTLAETRAHPDMLGACFQGDALRAEVLAYMQEAGPGWRTFPTRTKGGALIQTSWANVKLSDGTSIGIGQDVTQRHRAQAALREHSERLALALAAAQMGTWDYDLATDEVFWSEETEALFGLQPGTFEGEKEAFYARIHPEDRERVRAETQRTAERREPLDVMYRIGQAGGRVRWMRSIGRFQQRGPSKAGRMIGLVMDVTQQRRYEEGLIEAKDEAERARREAEEMARLKDSFLSNMSHEIRTPLTSILGFSEVLAEEVEEPAHELVTIIRTSASRLKETLNSVLDLAQLESMSMTLEAREIDVAAEVREVAAIMAGEAERRALDLRVELPPRPLAGHFDRRALHRILMNLTSNALKFTEEGYVRLRAHERAGGVELVVEDTGIGMDPERLPQLFEPFRQASEGLTRRHEGSGLGLAITARLVELMGGEMEVETAEGEGSVFRLRLPSRGTPADPEATASAPADAGAASEGDPPGAAEQGSNRVLLVEDRAETRTLVRHLLGGSQVTAVATGEEALAEARRRPYALLLLDISLGEGLSGTDILAALRRESAYEQVPAVALTAQALPGAEDELLRAGFDAYVAKPFEGARLKKVVGRLLRRVSESK